jgi:hypothetical protein
MQHLIGVGDNSKFIYDPGGNTFKTEDGSTHRNDATDTSNSGDMLCATADTRHSFDCNRDKIAFTISDVDPLHPPDFVQVVRPDVTTPPSTDDLPAILTNAPMRRSAFFSFDV